MLDLKLALSPQWQGFPMSFYTDLFRCGLELQSLELERGWVRNCSMKAIVEELSHLA